MKSLLLSNRYRTYIYTILIVVSLVHIPEILLGVFFTEIGLLYFFELLFIPLLVVYTNYLLIPWLADISKIKKIIIKLAVSIFVVSIATILFNEIEWWRGYPDDDTLHFGSLIIDEYWTNVISNIVITIFLGVILFIAEGIIDSQKNKIQIEKDRVANLNQELGLLKIEVYSANVKPHFIFNSLNGLLTLIHENPDKAEKMVLHLSSFLRSSLYSSGKNIHNLKDEFDMLNDYLSIESIRFGDKIKYVFQLNGGLEDITVPKFFLLPLVENCIKHNNSRVNIKIGAYQKDGIITIEVEDDGKPFEDNIQWNSGLKGTKSLLKSFFNDNFTINFLNEEKAKKVSIAIKK